MTAPTTGHYGPPPATVSPDAGRTMAPVLLPFNVTRGWREASALKRLLALAFPVMLLVWLVMMTGQSDLTYDSQLLGERWLVPAVWGWFYVFAGPPACYSAARVLRPHPSGPQVERKLRHTFAAMGSAYGFVVIMLMFTDARAYDVMEGQAGAVMLASASLLGPVTLIWGATAVAVRAIAPK